MKPTKHDLQSQKTLQLIHTAAAEADGQLSVIVRHSARCYPERPEMEAFMTLTEEGKDFACDLGQALPKNMKPRIAASYITRCMETADLISKGFAMSNGIFPRHTEVEKEVTPFYMRDIPTAVRRQREVGHDVYLRMWLNGEASEDEVLSSTVAADAICNWMVAQLDLLDPGEISIGVTHDWNLFPVKEHKLHQPHEEVGQVGYLEGLVVYRRQGELVLRGLVGDAVAL
jgi:phosphohistidine phosphatase SixA